MTGPHDRRGFLRGLATLPLLGGGVTLIGQPTASAEPVTEALLDSYNAWLLMERAYLMKERHGRPADYFHPNTPGGMYHWRAFGEPTGPAPSSRAAVVLSAVGCDWREL